MWGFKNKNKFGGKKYRIVRQQVKYKNPLSKRKGVFSLRPLSVINFFLTLGIGIFLYFFVFSNFYTINDIQVAGNNVISTDDILEITNQYLSENSLLIFKNDNIFVFSKNALKKRINSVIILDELKVDKILPNKVKLTLVERNSAIKWFSRNNEYLVDSKGQIIKRYSKSSTPSIFSINSASSEPQIEQDPVNDTKFVNISDLSNQEVYLGGYVLKPENVSFILNLQDKLKSVDYMKFSGIEVPNAYPQYLSLITAQGCKIHLNMQDNLDAQLKRVYLLIEQKIKQENLNKVEYIDMRLGESIYYLYKGHSKTEPELSVD